ncbi:MAG TPA: metal-sensing transcriptional repressor [Firmicutes bacterium]|nr:metal-sensing transcriptional repressor [Bacillota bacterium]
MRADRELILRKLRTVQGQIAGLIKMVEEDRYCIDISNQLLASIGILRSINKEVLDAHLKHCVTEAFSSADREAVDEKVAEIIKIIDKLA